MSGLVVAVVGPTAAGKSDLALDLAELLHAQVVNADAMQLYRGMDIGTAKLPVHERRGVTHHLLDVLDVTDEASVADVQRQADAVLDSRGDAPVVVVGGSGLYVSAIVDHLDIPPTDPQVREHWQARLDEVGPAALHTELARRDPAAAAAILPSNGRRIVRALEVVTLTGGPFTASLPQERRYRRPTVQIGLDAPRAWLDERIEARVHRMWADGLLAEVETLVEQGLEHGRTASRAIGYAQVLASRRGELTPDEAVTSTVTGTRRLVRRQQTWFRRDPRISWVDPSADGRRQALELVRSAADRLVP